MKFKNNFTLAGLILLIAFLSGSIGCDSILPDEYQDKEYSSSDIDMRAAGTLAKDTSGYLAGEGDFRVVPASTILALLDENDPAREQLELGLITDNQLIVARYDEFVSDLLNQGLKRDSLLIIEMDSTVSIEYSALNVAPGESKDFYIYTSFLFNEVNTSEYLSVHIVNRDSSIASYSTDMPMETVSSDTQVIPVAGGTRAVPTIKARYHVHLNEGNYIVRFTKSNSTAIGPLAKLVILSI